MARAGLTPYEILRSATKNVGEYFRDKDKFGTITVGSRADLILLEKNPLKGVANIANPLGVMVRGRWLSQEDIRQKLTAISQQPQQKPANESA
jgi:imidazolonepropionase-like amidohydrolase